MMRRVVIASMLLACSSGLRAAALDQKTLGQVDTIFRNWQRAAHVPGLVYGIVSDGRLVTVQGLGIQDVNSATPVSAQTLFRIASMSKAFTSLAILKLRDEGKLSLDAPAENYVPELKGWRYPTTDSPRITIRNLLTHSAGFVEDNPWGDRQQVMTEAEFTSLLGSGVSFARAPGLAMEYSNLGYAILGRIVSNVSGVRYEDYIRRDIMIPLGMSSSGYDIFASNQAARAIGYRWEQSHWLREPDMKDGAFGAMGGVQTSATDYAKWVAFLLSAWPARDGPETGPVRRSTVREVVTGNNFLQAVTRDPAIGGAPCRQARAYGMAWVVIDDCDLGRVIAHSGGYPGYGSYLMLLPDKGVGLFAFSSKTYGGASLPVWRAALALKEASFLPDRALPISAELTAAYDAARAVWRAQDVTAAPLANNVLMDHDRAAWAKMIGDVKADVGACDANEPIKPVSALEGRFSWTCTHGRVDGRVQRAPTRNLAIQALEFASAKP